MLAAHQEAAAAEYRRQQWEFTTWVRRVARAALADLDKA